MATWEDRLGQVFGNGYENCYRRSLQTIILYEANRCVADTMPSLRPFQRKVAYWDMANALVDSLSSLAPHQKEEVMWRTGTSKEAMQPDTAWKRRKLLNKELEKIAEAVTPFMEGRTHDQAVDAYIQQQFEAVTGNKADHPKHWEHAHNNAIMCYRLYYNGSVVDPNFPPPKPPKEVLVVDEKPVSTTNFALLPARAVIPPALPLPVVNRPGIPGAGIAEAASAEAAVVKEQPDDDVNPAELEEMVGDGPSPDDRRLTLKEVREHLDLLKEFEGVIPQEELVKRKRELFLALPPAPPPGGVKRKRQDDES
mmetsp:Transcript_13804/g.32106  ORF Transcript_13804/g.32106 Transcript_13804/m.32106 type:complete len:310 (+) Transcript_13804:80-1009(+)